MIKNVNIITIVGEEDAVIVPTATCEERTAILNNLVQIDVAIKNALEPYKPGFKESFFLRKDTAKKYGFVDKKESPTTGPIETFEERMVQFLEDLGVAFQ